MTHLTTIVRAAYRSASGKIPATLHVVISVDPFSPDRSAHLQTYDMNPNGTLYLRTTRAYSAESAAVQMFDRIHAKDYDKETKQ